MNFVQAKHYSAGGNKPRLIVLHSTEGHEREGEASNVAAWFADKAAPKFPAPKASAHYVVDASSVVQCVKDSDRAWHASDVNSFSIGIEIVGRAAQTADDWGDPYSSSALGRVAELLSELSRKHAIPLVEVDAAGILAGRSGVTTHRAVTEAYKTPRGHQDPGPNFPMAAVLARAGAHLTQLFAPSVPDVLFPATGPWQPTPRPGVLVVSQGRRFAVAPSYVGGVAIQEAQRRAAEMGFELPDVALVNDIWRAADLKIRPQTQSFKDYVAEVMDSPEAHARQTNYVMAQTRDYVLQAGAFKDVILDAERGIGLYGWHSTTGQPIQTPYFKHVLDWCDYSQGVRFVKRLP